MSEIITVYHRNAAGVHPVELPEIEACRALARFPWEYSRSADPESFAPEPQGFVASTGPAASDR
jgi:hypothetical protein